MVRISSSHSLLSSSSLPYYHTIYICQAHGQGRIQKRSNRVHVEVRFLRLSRHGRYVMLYSRMI